MEVNMYGKNFTHLLLTLGCVVICSGCAQEVLREMTTNSSDLETEMTFGKAIIGVGGSPTELHWQQTFLRLGQQVHHIFQARGFPDDRIRFLSADPTATPTDAEMTKTALRDAILNWGPDGLLPNENLYIYLLSDNLKKTEFILRSGVFGTERLEVGELAGWLDQLAERRINVVVVIEACYAGEFIVESEVYTQLRPPAPRRVVITSADASTQTYIMRTDSFSRRFFDRLHRNASFKDAFEETSQDMENSRRFRNTPQVDADGDGVANEPEDLEVLGTLFLGDPLIMSL
jgi:hypothetical protein